MKKKGGEGRRGIQSQAALSVPLSLGKRMTEDEAGQQYGHKLPAGHDCSKQQGAEAMNGVDNEQLTWHMHDIVSRKHL